MPNEIFNKNQFFLRVMNMSMYRATVKARVKVLFIIYSFNNYALYT